MPIHEVDKIWLDGELVPWRKANVHVLTHALHYGSGVYEGLRSYDTDKGPAVFRLTDHLRRLERSAKLYYMQGAYDCEELRHATFELIRANSLRSCYIRPLVFRGYGEMGLFPLAAPVRCMIAAWRWDAYHGEDAQRSGIRVKVSSFTSLDDSSVARAAKACGHYLNGQLAKIEAVKGGYDEAVLVNHHGHVVEGSAENVFVVRDGVVRTPPVADGALEGITRDTVLHLLASEGTPTQEQSISRSDLVIADEVFLTGTAAEIVPVREVDDHPLGEPGVITQRIQERYGALVAGRDSRFIDYLEYADVHAER